jgi:hypothetical protein
MMMMLLLAVPPRLRGGRVIGLGVLAAHHDGLREKHGW